MSPFLTGRPLSLVRREGQAGAELLLSAKVTPGMPAQWALQGYAEVRAANVLRDQPRRPDWLVLELRAPAGAEDPTARLARTALAAEELLARLDLGHVWKLIDPACLQVCVPIRRAYEPVAVFDISKMLAEMVFERVPEVSTLRAEGGGARAVIDYHLNHSGRLVIAPFSARVVGGHATVVLPLRWEQLAQLLASGRRLPVIGPEVPGAELETAAHVFYSTAASPSDLENAFVAIENLAQQLG